MAYKDLRAPQNPLAQQEPSADEQAQERINRILNEVAVEAGLSDSEFPLPGMSQPEEAMVVIYDKFRPTGQ